jgi:hypothetical protein
MEMLVVCPVTVHRSVDDWPRWIDAGSAVNWVICGAAGAGGGVTGAGAGGGGGGGGGTFFLQPAPTSANASAIPMTVNFHLLNMNILS